MQHGKGFQLECIEKAVSGTVCFGTQISIVSFSSRSTNRPHSESRALMPLKKRMVDPEIIKACIKHISPKNFMKAKEFFLKG